MPSDGPKVLVIVVELAERFHLAGILSRLGFGCAVAGFDVHQIEKHRLTPPVMIVLDMPITEEMGRGWINYFRSVFPDIPVLTLLPEDMPIPSGREATAFIYKPIFRKGFYADLSQIGHALIKEQLERKRAKVEGAVKPDLVSKIADPNVAPKKTSLPLPPSPQNLPITSFYITGSTFENFLPHRNNLEGFELCLGLAQKEPSRRTINLLWGPLGAGKSHLSEAIQRVRLENFPRELIISISVPDLTTYDGVATIKEVISKKPSLLILTD